MSETPSTLPPGVWAQVMAVLAREPDFPELMAGVLRDALTSSSWFYDKKAGKIEERADTRSRLDALKLILSYAEGMPLQRIFEHKIHEQRGNLADLLRESPETLEAVEREIEKAKFRTRNRVKNVVEIEPP